MEDNKMFSEMFGEIVNPPAKSEETKADETVATVEPTPQEAVCEAPAEEKKEETEEKEEEPTTKVTESQYNTLKKDMCQCGASFVDEALRTAPWILDEVKKGEKTLGGFFNYCYTYFLDLYIKQNGRVNGGAWCDIPEMAKKYFSAEVKEGTVFNADNVKFTKPAPSASRKSAAKTVEKVAKKAAKDAKKEAEKREKKVEKKEEPKPEMPSLGIDMSSISISSLNLSKIM